MKKNLNKRKVYCIELQKTFNSINACAREFGTCASNIISACNGRLKSCKGYHFKYVED